MLSLVAAAFALPAWIPGEAAYHLRVVGERVEVEMRYRFDPLSGEAQEILIPAAFAVTGASPNLAAAPGGLRLQLGPDLPAEVVLSGVLHAPGHALRLEVLPAARQRVSVDAPGLAVEVEGAVGEVLLPTGSLVARWAPPAPVSREERLYRRAEVATAAWVADGGLLVHSLVRWEVVRGSTSELRVDVAGLAEVEPQGAGLASWRREGDSLILITKEPVEGRFSVELRGRASPPSGAAVPAPRPQADRSERWWIVGRCDEGELVPESGPEVVTRRSLPAWARGLSETTPLAFWRGEQAPVLRYLRYDAVTGPDTVVARARHEVVANEDGRVFVRSSLRVRNERRQYLRLRPPEGFSAMGARVEGEPVTLLSDGEGGLLLPLPKSVETVRGLLSFPVELLWVGETEAFARRGAWAFRLPAVDAPIQRVDWEVHLPRGFRPRGEPVAQPATVAAAVDDAVARASVAYKQNRFDEAQAWLDSARSQGADDEDVGALQSNLDVLQKKDGDEDSSARRIRELANAKNVDLAERQQVAEKEVEKAIQSGDYARAEELNRFVEESAAQLALTEQRESGEQAEKKKAVEARKVELARRAPAKASKTASVEGGVVGGVVGGEPTGVTVEELPASELSATVPASPEAPMPVLAPPEPAADAAPAESVARTTAGGAGSGAAAGGRRIIPTSAKPRRASERSVEDEAVLAAPAAADEKSARDQPAPILLEARAAPLTLALPLDGPAVGGSDDLLPAGAFPTFTVTYRGPR